MLLLGSSLLSFTLLCSCLLMTIVAQFLQSVNPATNYEHGRSGHTGLLRWLGSLSGGTHAPGRVLHTETAGRWHLFGRVLLLRPEVGQHGITPTAVARALRRAKSRFHLPLTAWQLWHSSCRLPGSLLQWSPSL